ncbi:hypothetical protein Cha6605_2817 [Chamaesiphon minutus PCC 6605]|uniref:Uncharacterized protein n=1 Tax=Chamaesiphon minutus (strain ATCC 27169 / PCC 6605) TaxID=1173020 RepID=K9UGT7_CHAP6|nr:hypothetical protein Cha6605_2817 [Chamaesiphon minutus PCC 6605]
MQLIERIELILQILCVATQQAEFMTVKQIICTSNSGHKQKPVGIFGL